MPQLLFHEAVSLMQRAPHSVISQKPVPVARVGGHWLQVDTNVLHEQENKQTNKQSKPCHQLRAQLPKPGFRWRRPGGSVG